MLQCKTKTSQSGALTSGNSERWVRKNGLMCMCVAHLSVTGALSVREEASTLFEVQFVRVC